MQKQEFEKRTPFLDEADREHYAEWYEPAPNHPGNRPFHVHHSTTLSHYWSQLKSVDRHRDCLITGPQPPIAKPPVRRALEREGTREAVIVWAQG